jgi:ATP-dependent DNA helicase RecG
MRDLASLLTQPEGQYFERKSLWEGPPEQRKTRDRRTVRDQIAKYVAAFANADGGTLVMGIEDDETVSGHGYSDEAIEDMQKTPQLRLNPPQAPGERVPWQGYELLLFEVPPAERAVMVHGDGFPRRVHDAVVMESEEAINAIKARSRLESIESETLTGVSRYWFSLIILQLTDF